MPTAKPKITNRPSNSSRRTSANPTSKELSKVEGETRESVRPRRKHQQRNGGDVDNDRRKHDTQTTALDRNFTRAFDNHDVDLTDCESGGQSAPSEFDAGALGACRARNPAKAGWTFSTTWCSVNEPVFAVVSRARTQLRRTACRKSAR